ncbi:hypothetical protein F5984_23520 [Rudanella paleaurantiibacter]|uniref:Uncharacterized protein n=1 Tax=Rudanella paleaurantiibacter TaxID=2614655 RepID=A0A7J5TTA0_9BACT|nr:hypothetical protein [Rudanella paleaurantiibacter]KAB7726882.1 hypothetical protein F5984_23520 [Rudanella paleaurantiibacter]
MSTQAFFTENTHLVEAINMRDKLLTLSPEKLYPWWRRPCTVKLLLLTDGILDFGLGDFGLATFVSILANDGRAYVDFQITIAHRGNNVGNPNVAVHRSIPNFRFTDGNHFNDTMYDQVWLFGIDSSAQGLSDAELVILSTFMNKGGGVFATGDHGELGRALCGSVPRVRKMRLWTNSAGNVGMQDANRNDTNRIGHDAGSQFDDQSDDVPQEIQPRLYSSALGGFLRETYPHPILCSPLGRIRVLPDHPHEGQCVEPTDLSGNYEKDGTPEFPMGIGPEIIAYSTVLAGSTAGTKQATQAQTFGAICAYDGHLANIGRVVTDSTWHHYVNVNLIGEVSEPDTNIKGRGFLASATGQQHLAQIKHYYINTAVWLSRPGNHSCFRSRLIWQLLFEHRVMEATMDNPALRFERISPSLLYSIGTHATDVLGKKASQCRRLQLLIDIIQPILPDLIPHIDPWQNARKQEVNPPLPFFDVNPLLAMAMGGGLVRLRDKYINDNLGDPNRIESKEILAHFEEGAKRGLEVGLKELNTEIRKFSALR